MEQDRHTATDGLHTLILKTALSGFWQVSMQGRLVEVNNAYCRMSGYTEQELLGKHISELDAIDDTVAVAARTAEIMKSGGAIFETKHRRKDGMVYDVEASVQYQPADGGRMVAFIQDITERKRADEALRDSEDRFRTLTELAPIGIYLTSPEGDCQYANPRWCEMAGLSSEEALGSGWSRGLHPEDRDVVFSNWQKMVTSKGRWGMEYRFQSVDGTVTWVYGLAVPQLDATGHILRYIGINIDITDLKHLEERLRHSEKMAAIGQLAGGVAHDFNNQLAGILGFAEMLEARLDDPNLKRQAGHIRTAAMRAADLTKQLLAFSRKGKYLSVPVDLHKVIAEVMSLLSHSIDKKVELLQHLAANPATVLGDPTQLQNALLNLAVNASDAMPNGGTLSFSTSVVELQADPADPDVSAGRHVQLRVADTGTGMDAEVMKHLFEPFFTTKAVGKGTGLGLAAVHGAVKNHRGTIRVESQPGKGTTFTICLPLQVETSSRSDSGVAIAPKRGDARILVVDDEELVRDMMADLLRGLGYKVMTFADGEEAIGYYRQSWAQVDLVILDMVMPRMGGKDTFLAMRTVNPGVKAILSSGHSITGDAQSILDEGALAFVQKPFNRAELAKQIAAALSESKTARGPLM